jgi:hypothetical protein
MSLEQGLNIIGLLLITFGSISAAMGTPAPQYNADGSVSMSGEPDQEKRIAIYKKQKRFPKFLAVIGIGALIQAIAQVVG